MRLTAKSMAGMETKLLREQIKDLYRQRYRLGEQEAAIKTELRRALNSSDDMQMTRLTEKYTRQVYIQVQDRQKHKFGKLQEEYKNTFKTRANRSDTGAIGALWTNVW